VKKGATKVKNFVMDEKNHELIKKGVNKGAKMVKSFVTNKKV